MSEQTETAFVASCPDCRVEEATDDPNDVVAFYDRHRSVTGHDVEWVRADLDGRLPDGDLKDVVSALEDRYERGVPVGAVAAAMHERGVSIAETKERIYDLRMNGELWEPRDDHLRAY